MEEATAGIPAIDILAVKIFLSNILLAIFTFSITEITI